MKKKIFLIALMVLLFACLFAIGVSAKDLYLEEIPDDLKIDGDTVTHFLVIEGEEYYGGGNGTVNAFNLNKISEEIAKLETEGGALNKLGYSASDLGTKFLTKLIIPGTYNGTTVTYVDINNSGAFKSQTYFKNCGYLEYPSSMTKTNDGNDCNHQLRCIDFGENSQLAQIPYCYMNAASKLICLKNMPKNLTSIEESAFMACVRLQGDENGQLYIGAATVKYKAFDRAMKNVKSIVFGENVSSLASESFSNDNGDPGVVYIEFKCDVSQVAFPANSTTVDHTGAFYFGTSSSQRNPYSNLKCIILSNPAQAGCDGQTFRSVSGQDVFFNDITGEDDFVYTSHAMQSLNGCQESCSRCAKTRLKAGAVHENVYTFNSANGNEISYLNEIYVYSTCTVCGTGAHYETIDKIFIPYGYSVDEGGTTGGVTHKVKINIAAKNRYEQLSGAVVYYGVVAGIQGNDSTGNLVAYENNEIVAKENAIAFDFTGTSYDILELKLTNINKTASVYCNAFILNGEKVAYICGENESKTAIAQNVTIEAKTEEE